jgi:DNA-binding NtrC family response regulator
MSEEKRRIKLLFVDDEPGFLEAVGKRLGMSDFDVVTAQEGREAIKAAKKGKFDVALVDLQMPELDGSEVLRLLKKRHKFLEVIILTGHATLDSAVECTKLGAFGYLEKPYEFEKLVDVLKQAYEARLRKKFQHDKKRMEHLDVLSMGSSPMAVLRSLLRLDDTEK